MRKRRYSKNTYNIDRLRLILVLLFSCIVIFILIIGMCLKYRKKNGRVCNAVNIEEIGEPEIEEAFLTPNRYSRPGDKLKKVNAIVVHYTANPGSDAMANRNYFEGLKDSENVYASSHYIIGIDGKIVQCIPLEEISYASNSRNNDTVSIECCHPDKTGIFTTETYKSLVWLVAWLCGKYDITKDNIIRHYDITGKNCPKYYVKHEDEWKKFKNDVFLYIKKNSLKDKKRKKEKDTD